VITLTAARRLRAAGLRWSPQSGDRFVVTGRDMDSDVFVVSEMTVEVQDSPLGRVIGFNGTTEWALDSIEQHDTVWLPRETQLRELLAGTFRTLQSSERGWLVTLRVNGENLSFEDPDAEEAYAAALHALLRLTH
jgi:hypothetical protein